MGGWRRRIGLGVRRFLERFRGRRLEVALEATTGRRRRRDSASVAAGGRRELAAAHLCDEGPGAHREGGPNLIPRAAYDRRPRPAWSSARGRTPEALTRHSPRSRFRQDEEFRGSLGSSPARPGC